MGLAQACPDKVVWLLGLLEMVISLLVGLLKPPCLCRWYIIHSDRDYAYHADCGVMVPSPLLYMPMNLESKCNMTTLYTACMSHHICQVKYNNDSIYSTVHCFNATNGPRCVLVTSIPLENRYKNIENFGRLLV